MLIPRKEKGQLEIYKCKLGNLDVEDLKRIRKVIRKAIRNHENNKSV